MATLLLGTVGSLTPLGPVGGFIGAAIGGAIDNFILFPRLFPTTPITGPRLDDLQVQVASDGSPLRVVFGPRNRIAGTVTWMSPLIEHQSTQHQGKGGAGQSSTSYTYTIDMLIKLASTKDLPINRITRVWANSDLVYNRAATDAYDAIRFRFGNETTPSSLIESYIGVGKVPKFKKGCYCELEGFSLTKYGGSPPNFTFEVEQDADMSVGAAITAMLKRAGFADIEIDVTRVGFCFKGCSVAGPQATADILNPILVAYGLGVQEGDDKLVFFPLGSESEFTIDPNDLAAHSTGGDAPPRKVSYKDTNDNVVPGVVNVKYLDIDFDLQAGAEVAQRIDHPGNNVVTADIPITLNRTEAHATAERLLWVAEQERQGITITLPPSYIFLRENDVVNVTDQGQSVRMLISQIDRGANYEIKVTGRLSYTTPYQQSGQAGTAGVGITPYSAPATAGCVFDGPALIDDHTTRIGVYWAAAAKSASAEWRGVHLFQSTDGTTYADRGTLSIESAVGRTLIGPTNGPADDFDDTNTIDVQLYHGSIGSVTKAQCLAGSNRFAIKTPGGEWEVLGAATSTQLSATTFRLSSLLRGLRGTEHLINSHAAAGAPFLVLSTDGSVAWWDRGLSALGTNDYYKFPGTEGNLDKYTASRLTIRGISERPFSPTHLAATFGPDLVLYGNDISASATDNSFNSTTAGRFAAVQVGQPIQVDGFTNTGNNAEFVVIARPTPQKLIVAGALTTEAASNYITVRRGGDDDFCVTWQRRSKRFITPFQTSSPPLTADETPETYVLEFRAGGLLAPVLRTETVHTTSYVYTWENRQADGFSGTSSAVTVSVYQISNDVGRSIPATGSYFR